METQMQRLQKTRWVQQIPLGCAGMFATGATLAYSVFATEFTPHIQRAFLKGCAYRTICGAMGSMVGGLFWDSHRRAVCAAGILFHCFLLLLPYAVLRDNAALLLWSTALVGAGNMLLNLASVLTVSQWLADQPALGMSLSMLANSSGLILGSMIFSALSDHLSIAVALFLSGLLLVALATICLSFVHEPSSDLQASISTLRPRQAHLTENEKTLQREAADRSARAGVRLGHTMLVQLELHKVFLMYSVGQAVGYTMIVTFSSLMDSEFDVSRAHSTNLFSLVNVLGLVARVSAGFFAQSFQTTGFFWCGPKNSALLCLLLQTLACLYMAVGHALVVYLTCISVTIISYCVFPTFVLMMASQLFSPVNAGLTYALGNGFTCLICTLFSLGYTSLSLSTRWAFFACAAATSAVAFLVTLTLKQCEAAFEFTLPDGREGVLVESLLLGQLDQSKDQQTLRELTTTEVGFELLHNTLEADENAPQSLEIGFTVVGAGWVPIDFRNTLLVGVVKDRFVTEVLERKLYHGLPRAETLKDAIVPLGTDFESWSNPDEETTLLRENTGESARLEIVEWSAIPEDVFYSESLSSVGSDQQPQ
ncbi:hypothetical protein FVE85_2460 [Porphyridium purpureum]|uniref:Uncharacterized protein n=1 Tax=Porphyridium purpureum TaxID=35688 RepID=A0A5J4YJX2_PORPP|nr:hypothetical protein FVE85_2460 [Porphyridium purpureum]|eukprot:POR4226..scf291_13